MRSQPTNQQKTNSVEVQSQEQINVLNDPRVGLSFVAVIPILALLSVLGYQKYRRFVKRQQVALLERIWLLDVNKKTH